MDDSKTRHAEGAHILLGMIGVVAAAALTCAGALILGQGACWLCGVRGWTFLSAPVGLALLLLICAPTIHAPGRASTIAVLLLILCLAGVVLMIRNPAQRPRVTDLMVAGPTLFMVLIPFLASGRAGTLGVSFDNDMATHLLWAEAIKSASAASVTSLDTSYPVGPHGLCAVLAQALGVRVDYAFAGETMAVPLLLAWTSLASLRRASWPGKTFVATMTACTFMVVAYYGQGSFKEIMQALFVLGFAIALGHLMSGQTSRISADSSGRLRWVPLGLIAGGSLSVYSASGLPWLLATLVLWLTLLAVRARLRFPSTKAILAAIRAGVIPAVLGCSVLVVLVAPQLGRIARFYAANVGVGGGAGVPINNLGNLAAPLSFWKVFGMWDIADYRFPAQDLFHVGMYVGFGLILTIGGGIWWLRRDSWTVPIATGIATAIWIYSDHNQSPYVTAKALVILAPLVMIVATRWLVELNRDESWLSLTGALRVGVAGLLGWAALGTSVEALRIAYVGPTAHASDLRALQPSLGRAKTLFLGWDDFIQWELAGTPVNQPFLGYPLIPFRPQADWSPGEPLEFSDIPAQVLDRYTYIVAPRNIAGTAPPPNIRLIRTTKYYEVYRREGPTPDVQTVANGPGPGASLNCKTSSGRRLAHLRGIAAVGRPNVAVQVPAQPPGSTAHVQITLSPGRWSLSTPYTSPHPINVEISGRHITIPANLDRAGDVWPVGEITVTRRESIPISFRVQNTTLTMGIPTYVNALWATNEKAVHIVPLRQACGQYVEWYLPS